MTFDLPTILAVVTALVTQFEGPYKWYIMGAVAFMLTAFITRFIFKTFKWFLLLVILGILIFGGFYFLTVISLGV